MRILRSAAIAAAGLACAGAGTASAALVYATSSSNNLLRFNSATPNTVIGSVAISGLSANENVLGIDFRPMTGELFALGSFSRLYTINTTTGAATLVGSGLGTTLDGTQFGFDFNPMIDRIRVVSETDSNYVINPITGAVQATATPLFYGAGDPNAGANPNVVDSAYNNNFVGTATTQLYGIDTNLDILVTQANSAGTLGTVGSLGFDASAIGGFDIETGTNIAYASIIPSAVSTSNFYTINLATGAATLVGQINGGIQITALTVAVPEPTSFAAIGALSLALLRRRK